MGNATETEITISTNAIENGMEIKVSDGSTEAATLVLEANTLDRPALENMPFHQEVLEASEFTTLDPALIHAVIAVESQHNPHAVSKKGARGLMQLMPSTAQRYGLARNSLHDNKKNVLVGAQYLKALLESFNGNLELALAAYNAGPAAVKRYHDRIPPFEETKHYVPKVMNYYRKYSG